MTSLFLVVISDPWALINPYTYRTEQKRTELIGPFTPVQYEYTADPSVEAPTNNFDPDGTPSSSVSHPGQSYLTLCHGCTEA